MCRNASALRFRHSLSFLLFDTLSRPSASLKAWDKLLVVSVLAVRLARISACGKLALQALRRDLAA